jgi:hypothetical protein
VTTGWSRREFAALAAGTVAAPFVVTRSSAAVNNTDVDVVVSGEQQEADGGLDSPAYVLDAASLGIPKGWIMLGHNISEEQGMLEMAQWIKGFVPEVPVQLVKAGEPFWAPR